MAKKKSKRNQTRSVTVEVIERPAAKFDAEAGTDPEVELAAELAAELEANPAVFDPSAEVEFNPAEIEAIVARGRKAARASARASTAKTPALTTIDPITTYLAEIKRYPLLTREQEQALAIQYRETGDSAAAERLVTANLRFVIKIAAEYSKFGSKLIDLVQEGNVGLMHAVKQFNPYKNVRLITYAVWWIRGYIQEYLMRQYSMVRIGTTQNQRKLFYRLQRERRELEAFGQESNFALLSSRLGVPQDEVETMAKRMSGRDVSLNAPLDSESSATMLDLESSNEIGVDERLGRLEELKVLSQNLDSIRTGLTEKETFILDKRILADDPLTLQEIGDRYGVTREAVRQLEARLIGRIRRAVVGSLEPSE